MILADANLLLYAYNPSALQHAQARAWLEDALSSGEPFGLSWATVLAFLRLATSARIFPQPLSMIEAVSIVSSWLAVAAVSILSPGERHWGLLQELIHRAQVRDRLVMDAHLAALAIEHGAVLFTNDADFSRFPGLKVRYPLREQD